MSKRAEDFQNNHKQLYEVDSYPIEVVKELERNAYIAGEKETIERAIAWLDENADKYIINCTDSYPDAPFKAIIGRRCWDDLREAMGQEPKNYRVSVKDMMEVSGWRSAKDEKPNPSEWVVVCVKDHGVPQCLALATYNEQLDRWFTDDFEDGEPEEYFPDYWLRIPNFK